MPQCDFCEDDAVIDAPTVFGGSWAYMCETHKDEYGVNLELGSDVSND